LQEARSASASQAGLLARAVLHPLAPLGVAAAALLAQLPIFDRFFSAMDEGHMLAFADLVVNGPGVLYRDATSYPLPGAFYLLAGVFRVFEPSIAVARGVVVVEFAVFVALVFAWLRRIASPAAALAGVGALALYRVWAFPHWQMYSYSSTALVVLVGSVLLLVRHLESGSRRALAGSGVVFGLGVFCKQDYGAAFLLATLATLGLAALTAPPGRRAPGRDLATFLGPAAAVGAAAGLLFWWQGQLGLVVQMTVLNHFIGLSSYAYEAHPGLLPLFQQDPALRAPAALHTLFPSIVEIVHGLQVRDAAWFRETALYDTAMKLFIYGPHAVVALLGVRLWRRRAALRDPQARPRALAFAAFLATAASLDLLAALYRPQDYLHLAVLYWPVLCGAVVGVDGALTSRRRRVATALVLGPPLAAAALYSLWLAASLRDVFSEPVPLERAGVYAKPAEARLLADLTAYIRERSGPDDTVAIVPYFPIAHFLAERRGPHGAAYIVWPFPEYPDRDRRIVEAIEARRTPLVIYNFTQFPQFPPVSEYAPELYQHLVERFRVDRVFSYEAFGYSLAGLVREPPARGEALAVERGTLRLEPPRQRARDVPPRRREAWLRVERWPFRTALALRPLPLGRTVLSLPVPEVPPGARLETAVGVHPKLWFRHPPTRVHFRVTVRDGDGEQGVYTRALDPHLVLEDRGWFEVSVPLDAWAGRAVVIELATTLDGARLPPQDALRMGGWALPRLVVEEGAAPDQ